MFSIFGKDDMCVSHKYNITLRPKKQRCSFPKKKTVKSYISGIIEKDDIHPRKYSISFDRKTEDDKNVYFYEKVPMILFNGDYHWGFHILLSNEKIKEIFSPLEDELQF